MPIKQTQKQFIEKAKLIHGDKYDYSLVYYINNSTKVKVVCPIHGLFEIRPNSHNDSKQGCRECQYDNNGIRGRKTTQWFVDKCSKIHNNKFDYSNVNFVNKRTKVIIICPEHGEFIQKAEAHLNGKGCLLCSNDIGRKTTNEFINQAKVIHNNLYEYHNTIYKSQSSNLIITCKLHGDFKQRASNHLHGTGCPICNLSKGELKILNWLQDNNINYNTEYRFNECKIKHPLPFDFYLPNYNICIEYDGIQHFEPHSFSSDKSDIIKHENVKAIQKRDLIKTKFCEENNIKLIRIPYTKFNEIENILNSYLIKKGQSFSVSNKNSMFSP